MMKNLLLFCGILVFCSFSARAQFGILQKKLNEKVSEKAAEAIKKKQKQPSFDFGKMIGGSAMEMDVTYDFDFEIDWLITSSDEEDPMRMAQLFSTNDSIFGITTKAASENADSLDVHSVIDFGKSYMIMLNPEDMRAMVFAFENIEDQVEKQAEQQAAKKFTLTKTGKTKTIAGYLCNQYLYSGEDGNGQMWTTKSLSYKNFDVFTYFQKLNQQNNIEENTVWNSGAEGFILEIDGVNEEGKPFKMTALKVDTNAEVVYKMEEYEVMDMRGLSKLSGGVKE
ncbi:MAG: DUF4412 domain-containing protein [Bacteroidia bacterium]|nr:DUF4412 domain-containing protein [Bacteroidia bacterium]